MFELNYIKRIIALRYCINLKGWVGIGYKTGFQLTVLK